MKLNNSGVINIFILLLVAVSVLEGVVLTVCRPDSFGFQIAAHHGPMMDTMRAVPSSRTCLRPNVAGTECIGGFNDE